MVAEVERTITGQTMEAVMRFKLAISKLGRFKWTLHNVFAHPLSEVLHQVGLESAGNWVHDATIPAHLPGSGRG